MQLKTIAIAGPGGNVGSAVVKKLLDLGQFDVSAIVRTTSKYGSTAPEGVRVLVADFGDLESLAKALGDQDALLCLLPGSQTMFPQQKLMIDASIEAGVKLFFADEFVGDITSPHFARFPTQFVGEKLLVRDYLGQQAAAGKISWTALNAGPFFDMWLRFGHAGFDIAGRKATIYGAGNNLSCWTPIHMVATAMANMLRNPDPILNRGILISGVKNLMQTTLLAALEEEIGAKFAVEHVDIEKIKKDAFEALERGEPAKAMRGMTINSNFNENDSAANFWDRVENELVGIKPVTVREAVREVLSLKK